MPTSSAAGFELRWGTGVGVEAALPAFGPPWQAAVGNKERLVCFERDLPDPVKEAGTAGRVGRVAIDSLAARGGLYSPFVRLVNNYFALFSPVRKDKFLREYPS